MGVSYVTLLCLWVLAVHGGKYPDGPNVESQPLITSYSDPLPTAFFIILGFSCGYMLLYGVIRLVRENMMGQVNTNQVAGVEMGDMGTKRDPSGNESGGTSMPEDKEEKVISVGAGKDAVKLEEVSKFYLQGYQNWFFGQVGVFSLGLYIAWNFTLFILIMFDVYWGCQTGGFDNQCYYGSQPIAGGDQFRRKFTARFFFWYWWVTLVSLVLLLALRDYIWNFFRVTSDLNTADMIYLWVRDEEEVLCVDPTIFVIWGRYVVEVVTGLLGMTDFGHCETVPILHMNVMGEEYMYIEFEFTRYIVRDNKLHKVSVDISERICDLPDMIKGVSAESSESRIKLLGRNEIGYRIDTLWELFAGEFFSFFYLYQWQIYLVWFYWAYLFTAAAEYVVVLFSASLNMALKRMNQTTIAQLTAFSSNEKVRRPGQKGWLAVDGKDLVPGDVIQIQSDTVVPCDVVLLEGTAVIDESGLTGESMPISKVSARTDAEYNYGEHGASKYKLWAGTKVLQAGNSTEDVVTAVVMRTGINTEKGDLVSHILHPSKMTFKYDEEYVIAFIILLSYGIFGLIMTLVLTEAAGSNAYWVTRFNKGIFTMSQMLSPLLPLSLSVGQAASSTRLNGEMNIFCVNPKRIAICGKIRLCAFDKTGTLTKEGLEFLGAVPVAVEEEPILMEKTQDVDERTKAGLATCHAVTAFDGGYVGNQVEVRMFQSTGWELIEKQGQATKVKSTTGREIVIPKRFEFDHAKMTMSVITESDMGRVAFTKGSFEKMYDLCDPETLPKTFISEAEKYAKNGCYVLGLACKVLDEDIDVSQIPRDEIEKPQSMTCLGLILFRNELKDDTAKAIADLREGDVRNVMITGDNAQCGYYIAKQSTMIREDAQVWLANVPKGASEVIWTRQDDIDAANPETHVNLPKQLIEDTNVELAITGSAYKTMDEELLDSLILKTRIYARMSPDQKTNVMTRLIKKGIVCGYCGDGGNDCGALRVAHAGLALSEAEASVVAPFTGKDKSCYGMVNLLREGRCALATSFACWKFIITFGQAYIICKLSCVYFDAIMPSIDYLFIDIIILISISFGLTLNRPLDKLGKDRPTASLLGPCTVGSIGGITVLNFLFVIISWAVISGHDEYRKWPIKCEDGDSWWLLGDNWEAFNAFNNFIFQIFTAGFVFGFGSRFRKPIYENYILCATIAGGFLCFTIALLSGENGLTEIFHFPQTNYNAHGTESTTWGFYQNVNEHGLPFFGDEAGCPYYAVDETHSWHSLYPAMDYCLLTRDTADGPWTVTNTVKAEGVQPETNPGCTRVDKSDDKVTITYTIPATLAADKVTENPADDTTVPPTPHTWDIECTVDKDYADDAVTDPPTNTTNYNTGGDFNNDINTNQLYFGLISTTLNKGEYYPAIHDDALAFDTCAGNACIAAHPGCDCGMDNGVPTRKDNDYAMDGSLRFSLFLIVFFNSSLSMLWVWQGVDGFGRDAVKSEKPNYIKLDM